MYLADHPEPPRTPNKRKGGVADSDEEVEVTGTKLGSPSKKTRVANRRGRNTEFHFPAQRQEGFPETTWEKAEVSLC